MDRSGQRGLQYLALPTAASVVQIQLVGTPPDASAPIEMRKTLEDVAHSLASLARIYSMDELSGVATEIPASELIYGTFTRGAHAFVTKSGKEYRRLVVQRVEMEAAILILTRACVHG
jgi:hypothetical protein